MKISEVIEALNLLQQSHGDLPVKVYADHGQYDMNANAVDLFYMREEDADEYMIETSHSEIGEFDEDEIVKQRKIVVLGKQDEVIPPYITKIMLENEFYYEVVLEEMGHRTPLNIFINTINTYKNEL